MVGQSVSYSATSNPSANEPVMRAVLASLDIQLEEELARYRRHRLLQRQSRSGNSSSRAKASAPASIPASPAGVALPAVTSSGSSAAYPELMPSPWDEPDTVAITPVPQTQVPEADSLASVSPDDYLESSEHLLRSLGEDEYLDTDEPDDSLLNQFLTPLGIGAVLLLLVSSAMLGFLLVNPSMFGLDRWGDLFQRGRDSKSSVSSSDTSLTSDASTSNAPPYPNLAADEFIDLNLDTLSTLPGRSPAPAALAANPSPTPSPSASPNASPASVSIASIGVNSAAPTIVSTNQLPSRSSSPSAPAPAPARTAVPHVSPAPAAAAPAAPAPAPVAAAPASAAPASTTASAPGSYYYVVTDYSGDRSLEEAQSVVTDAYVRNFNTGAQVQLGAFSSEEHAQELIQQLQQEGISAEVYQP